MRCFDQEDIADVKLHKFWGASLTGPHSLYLLPLAQCPEIPRWEAVLVYWRMREAAWRRDEMPQPEASTKCQTHK